MTGRGKRLRPALGCLLLVVIAMSGLAVAAPRSVSASAEAAVPAPRISVGLPVTPAFGANAGDPDVVFSNGIYYAFTTGTRAREPHPGGDQHVG